MNEERLKTVWEYLGGQGEDVGDYNTFKSVVEETPTRMKKVHSYLESKGEDVGTYGQFMSALEFVPKKEVKSKAKGEGEEVEELVWDLGSLNNTLVGDFLDDTYRSMLRGRKSGAAVNETLTMMIKGSSVTPENISDYVEAAKELELYGESDEMRNFIKEGGFETGKGWLELLKNPVTILSGVMVESLTGMMTNPVTGSIIAGGAASGAAMGGVGMAGTMPVAYGMASGVMESTSKFTEELNKELADRGLELNEENVTKLLEDEEVMSKIKQKAALKGAVIGVIDGVTAGISGKMATASAKAGVRGASKAKSVGKIALVEAGGGGGGELASQLVLGEPLDVTSIGLEAFAEIGSGSVNVLLPYAQEAVRQRKLRKNLDGIALERHKTNKPFYSIVNDEGVEVKISKPQAEEIIAEDPEAFLTGDVKIANDPELSQIALERLTPVIEDQDKIKTLINERDKKEIRLGEEARKGSQEQTTQEDGGVEVQGDIDPTVEVEQGAVEEGGQRPVSEAATDVSDTPTTDGTKPVQKTKVEAKPERKLSDIKGKYKDSTIDVSEDNKSKTLNVSNIEVPEANRGQGVGTNIVKDIIDYADNKGLKVTLTPTDEFGTSKAKLKKFYKDLGFVENTGKNKDSSINEDMYRNPEISNAVEDLSVGGEFTFTRPDGKKEKAVYKGEGKWRLPESGEKINENEFKGADASDNLNTLINQQILENGQTEILSDEQATSSTEGTTGTTTTDQSGNRGTINETTQTEEGGVSKPFVLTPDLNNVVKVGDDFYYTKEKRGRLPSNRKVEAENLKTAKYQYQVMDNYDKLIAQGEDVVKNFADYKFPIVRRDGKFYLTTADGKVTEQEAKKINTFYKKQEFQAELNKKRRERINLEIYKFIVDNDNVSEVSEFTKAVDKKLSTLPNLMKNLFERFNIKSKVVSKDQAQRIINDSRNGNLVFSKTGRIIEPVTKEDAKSFGEYTKFKMFADKLGFEVSKTKDKNYATYLDPLSKILYISDDAIKSNASLFSNAKESYYATYGVTNMEGLKEEISKITAINFNVYGNTKNPSVGYLNISPKLIVDLFEKGILNESILLSYVEDISTLYEFNNILKVLKRVKISDATEIIEEALSELYVERLGVGEINGIMDLLPEDFTVSDKLRSLGRIKRMTPEAYYTIVEKFGLKGETLVTESGQKINIGKDRRRFLRSVFNQPTNLSTQFYLDNKEDIMSDMDTFNAVFNGRNIKDNKNITSEFISEFLPDSILDEFWADDNVGLGMGKLSDMYNTLVSVGEKLPIEYVEFFVSTAIQRGWSSSEIALLTTAKFNDSFFGKYGEFLSKSNTLLNALSNNTTGTVSKEFIDSLNNKKIFDYFLSSPTLTAKNLERIYHGYMNIVETIRVYDDSGIKNIRDIITNPNTSETLLQTILYDMSNDGIMHNYGSLNQQKISKRIITSLINQIIGTSHNYTESFINRNLDKILEYGSLSEIANNIDNKNISPDYVIDLAVKNKKHFNDYLYNWDYFLRNKKLTIDQINKLFYNELFKQSDLQNSIPQNQELNSDFLEKHGSFLDWNYVSQHQKLSKKDIDKFQNALDWTSLFRNKVISKESLQFARSLYTDIISNDLSKLNGEVGLTQGVHKIDTDFNYEIRHYFPLYTNRNINEITQYWIENWSEGRILTESAMSAFPNKNQDYVKSSNKDFIIYNNSNSSFLGYSTRDSYSQSLDINNKKVGNLKYVTRERVYTDPSDVSSYLKLKHDTDITTHDEWLIASHAANIKSINQFITERMLQDASGGVLTPDMVRPNYKRLNELFGIEIVGVHPITKEGVVLLPAKENQIVYQRDSPSKLNGFYDKASKLAYILENSPEQEVTTIHESFTHPFLEATKLNNKELYNNLVAEANKDKDLVDRISKIYPDLKGTNLNDEIIAAAIDRYVRGELDAVKHKGLIQTIKEFFKNLSDELLKILNIDTTIGELSPDLTLKDIAQLSVYSEGKIDFNNQNNNKNEKQQSKGQPVQQSGKNNERVETDNQEGSDQRGSDTERTELQENVDGGGKSPSTSAKAPDLTPEQKKNAEINEKINRAASRLEKKFGINITDEQLEKGFDSISDLRDPSMSVGSFKIAVQAALDKRIQDTYEANKKSFFARFKAENMPKKLQKVLRFIKREFRSSVPVPKQMNESISDAKGGILMETHTAKILSDKLTRVSKKFSEADKLKLNDLLQSIDTEVEFSDSVDADTAKEVRYLVSQMRSHIDRLIRKLRDLGIFDQVFSDVLTNSQGEYINRIYMKHIDPKWVDKIPVDVWEAAKKDIRAELTQALADGRVREAKKKTFLEYLTSDNALDAYLSGMITGSEAGIYKSGTIEGTKDISMLKARKVISPIIRDFYGEVKDVDLNYINTVTKISQFVYNHKMIGDLQKVDDGTFFANSKRGPGWEQINKSESQSLLPFDKDTYMDGELYKHLKIQAEYLSEFTKAALRFNGVIKSGKTVYSPITQTRNFLSAPFWMMALGNNPLNPKKWKNFTRAAEMIFDVKNFFLDAEGNTLINSDGTFKQAANFGKKGKYNEPKFNVIRKAVSKALLNGDIKQSEVYGKNGSINRVVVEKYLEGRVKDNVRLWNELTRLQVVNQSVFAREIAEDFFQVKKGQNLSEVIGNNTPGFFKKLIDKPLEIYSRVDDFYRVSVFMNERSDWSNILYNKSIDDIIDNVDVKFEEGTNREYFELKDSSNKIVTENGAAKKFYRDEMMANIDRKAAVQVKNLYPNYSQTYPIVQRLKKTWLIGAFVSFSAEMWRTSYNQIRNVGELLRKDYNKKGVDIYDGNGNIINIKPLNPGAAKYKGFLAFTGLVAVGYITSNLARVLSRQFGFDDDEKDDILKDRAPWVETAILFEDRGDGKFRFVNPTSINPYGMFGDIGNAIKNEKGSTGKKFVAAIAKTLEPFLGLEISTEVISTALLDYLDEDNPDTREEKLYTFINELYKGLQPGFTYSAERIISPKITKAEMEGDINALSKKRRDEILATLFGVRISELDTQLSFILNTGPKILKNEARARKLMSQAMYKDELTGVKLDRVYGRAAAIYDEYLVEARENASRLRRIGVSEKDLVKIHKQTNFDSRTKFSGAELDYILGKTNYKPKFEVNGYNKESGSSNKNPTRRKTRDVGRGSNRRNIR